MSRSSSAELAPRECEVNASTRTESRAFFSCRTSRVDAFHELTDVGAAEGPALSTATPLLGAGDRAAR
jgi:hypothetical protein